LERGPHAFSFADRAAGQHASNLRPELVEERIGRGSVSSAMTDTDLVEQSFAIAWSVLEKSGELRDPNWSANFLLDEIIGMLRSGERRRLVLSNCAIDAYRHQPVKLVS
jgi:hypothetical protein